MAIDGDQTEARTSSVGEATPADRVGRDEGDSSRRAGSGRVTIAQIAEAAGVSAPTVSKVLNGREGVSSATRRQIQRLLNESGYEPRSAAQRRAPGLVELVIRDLDSLWATSLLRGAMREASRASVSLIVTATHGKPLDDEWLERFAARRTDGAILVVTRLGPDTEKTLEGMHVPLVLVDSLGNGPVSIPTVAATNWVGGLTGAEHLLSLGHTRIGVITGPMELMGSRDRLDGYRAAFGRAGVEYDEQLVRYGTFEEAGGYANAQELAGQLLDLPGRPTAIQAGSDQQAFGVYKAAQERRLRIPQDLSVIGFDDVPLCRWMSPALTTVRQPLEEMASEALRKVLEMGKHVVTPSRMEIATSLVVRESTAPPRG